MDLDLFVESLCNATKHGQRMTVVVRVFQPADDGSGRPDALRKLSLAQLCLGAQVVDLTCNAGV